jgi:hypothetical protein
MFVPARDNWCMILEINYNAVHALFAHPIWDIEGDYLKPSKLSAFAERSGRLTFVSGPVGL